MRQYPMFLEVRGNFRSDQCLVLSWVANAATSLALSKQFFVLAFFVHSMSLNTDMNVILSHRETLEFARCGLPENAFFFFEEWKHMVIRAK